MVDLWHKLVKIVDYERGKIVGLAIALLIGISIVGCEPKIDNPWDAAGPKIDRMELQLLSVQQEHELAKALAQYEAVGKELEARVAAYNQSLELAEAEIDRQLELRQKFIEIGGGIASTLLTGGTINAAAIIASLIGLSAVGFGTGAVVDKRRANRIIAENKSK